MLTFEMIRELERQEKASKKMQKLPENLPTELNEYIKRKEKMADKSSSDIMEMETVKNTIKRFIELRETKLIEMALTTARTGLAPENLTKEETATFFSLVETMKRHREAFFSEMNKEAAAEPMTAPQETRQERIIYRVKKELKEFVGPDMKTYRLVRGEIVNLPKPLNDLLLKEGLIEEIRE